MEGRSRLVTKLLEVISQSFACFGPQHGHLQCKQNCKADSLDACPLKKKISYTYLHVI